MTRPRHKKNPIRIFFAWIMLATTVGACGIVYFAESKLIRLVPGGWGESFSTKIYAYPFLVENEFTCPFNELIDRLHRSGYQPGPRGDLAPGQYRWADPILIVSLRGFSAPHMSQPNGIVKLVRWQKNQWHLKDGKENTVNRIALEPELIAELSGPTKVRREPASWEEFPSELTHAIVAIEDRRFFNHIGIDPRSIARAAWINVLKGNRLQGGSTITQQLAKNLFLTHRRTIWRKLVEAFLAIYLDIRYSKEHILTLYMNHIYLGQDGFISVAGVKAAAEHYFGKELKSLNLSESALLAGLIRSPYRYNPFQNLSAAKKRRDVVLNVMHEIGFINQKEAANAKKIPIKLKKSADKKGTSNENDYFVSEVVRRMLPRYNEDMLFRFGLKIYTTVDPQWQKKAQNAVQTAPYQAALIAVIPETGRVACLVGGKNYQVSQFNRATQALRQPGSAFKPFVYGAGLQNGFTPATLLEDKPRAYSDGKGKIWAPQNFDGIFRGPITLRQALAQSVNGATLDLAEKVGMTHVIHFARKMGIQSPIDKNLASVLGASEVTLIELTSAYAPFANGGFRIFPTLINAVQDLEGNILELSSLERKPVIEPALAYLMTSLLETTVREGTAKSLADMGWDLTAAGKTGTTNEGRDAWFIGYTPNLLVGVWAGEDEATSANLSGAKDSLPIWARFMKSINAETASKEFSRPQGLASAKIDPISGLLARSGCPLRKEELFIKGTEPTQGCNIHAGGLRGWVQRLFRKKIEDPPEGPDLENME